MGDDQDDDDYEEHVIILDNGSGTCKAGLSSDELPSHSFPAMIGKPRKVWQSSLDKEVYYGTEVEELRNKLSTFYPIENGIIENFNDMELLWEYTFMDQLKVNPADHPVLLTEPPYNPKPSRERMVETMFETFGVPSLNISIQGVLALLGQGRTTGLVLDSGEGVTHTFPIFDGFCHQHSIKRLDLAGRELNTLLAKLLAQEGMCLTTTVDQHHVRLMKERHCYVALDPSKEWAEPFNYEYTLPDGQTIRQVNLENERWKCPEALFNPAIVGLETIGVAGTVWESVTKCDIDVRKQLLSNIVLSGGSTMFEGFAARLLRELKGLAPPASQATIRVVQSKDQKNAVWLGAQVFATLRSMQEEQWMSIDDYDEYGASFIHDKISVKYS